MTATSRDLDYRIETRHLHGRRVAEWIADRAAAHLTKLVRAETPDVPCAVDRERERATDRFAGRHVDHAGQTRHERECGDELRAGDAECLAGARSVQPPI